MHLPHRTRTSLSRPAFACATVALACACSEAASVGTESASSGADLRPVELSHEKCDLDSKSAVRTDVNNDGRSEITRVMSGGKEICRAVDLNFDGKIDSYLYYDAQGTLRRRESDFDRDGIIDEIATFEAGVVVRKDRETNLDTKLDTWDFYTADRLTRRERDTNSDGRVDQWWSWPSPDKPDCPLVETDTDSDGRPDQRLDICKERDEQNAAAAQLPAAVSATAASTASSSPPQPSPAPAEAPDAGSAETGGAK